MGRLMLVSDELFEEIDDEKAIELAAEDPHLRRIAEDNEDVTCDEDDYLYDNYPSLSSLGDIIEYEFRTNDFSKSKKFKLETAAIAANMM